MEPISITIAASCTAFGYIFGYLTRRFTEEKNVDIEEIDHSIKSNIVNITEKHEENHDELKNILYVILVFVIFVAAYILMKTYNKFAKRIYQQQVPQVRNA